MQKTLRFAALAAAMSLTSWLTMGDSAQANYPPCRVYQGLACSSSGYILCDDDPPNNSLGACTCVGGHWNCGSGA
jgi:hypothetical protein